MTNQLLKFCNFFFNIFFINKPKIYKRDFQKADVFKTHGNNYKLKKFLKKINFINIEKSVYKTTFWYKKNFKLFN